MKKALSILLALTFVLGVAGGCTQTPAPASTTAAPAATTPAATTAAATTAAPKIDFPKSPIQMIVPYNTGGSTDAVGRLIAASLTKALGQQVNVVNKAGAGGEVGSIELANAKPDGYTIGTLGIADNIVIDGSKDSVKLDDLDLIGQFCSTPFGIFAKPGSQFKTVEDVVAYAKANPKKLTFGESGPAVRLYGLMFAAQAGIEITTVSFSSGGDSLNAVLGGHVEFALLTPSYIERVLNGKGSVIAVSGEKDAAYGDIGYLKDYGYTLEAVSSTPTVALPKGVPQEIRQIYIDALKKVHEDADFNDALKKGNYPAAYMIGDEFAKAFAANSKMALEALKANIDAFK